MEKTRSVLRRPVGGSSTSRDQLSVWIGNNPTDVDSSGKHLHECSGCGFAKRGADTCHLAQTRNLDPSGGQGVEDSARGCRYITLMPENPQFIAHSAGAGIGAIHTTFAPPNHHLIKTQFWKGSYWGPRLLSRPHHRANRLIPGPVDFFYISCVDGLVSPMGGWFQIRVNKSATAR